MMMPQERYVLCEFFVIVRWFLQKLQAHKLNMIKREKLARHPRTIWRIWACDVTPTSRMGQEVSNKVWVMAWHRTEDKAITPEPKVTRLIDAHMRR